MTRLLALTAFCLFLYGCDLPIRPTLEIANDAKIVFTSPAHETKNVQGKSPVTFLWDKPIFKLQNPEVAQQALHKHIKITPEIEGSWKILGTSGVVFEPKTEWQGATRYDFEFPGQIMEEYWFETHHLKITSIDKEKLIHKNPLIITFSEEISLEEAKKINITPKIKFDLKYHEKKETNKKDKTKIIIDKKIVELHPQENWLPQKEYTLVFLKGMQSLYGNMPTVESITRIFKSLGPLQIKKIHVPEYVNESAYIEFTTPVRKYEFFKNLSIETPASEAAEKFLEKFRDAYDDQKRGFRRLRLPPPKGGWQAGIQHKFLVNKEIEDVFGQKLGNEEGVIQFKPKFDNRIVPVYFPKYKWKTYRHGVVPKYSVWHTGEDLRDIKLQIKRIFPNPYTITHDFEWKSDPLQRTIQEFDLTKLAPEFIGEDGAIETGIYEIHLMYKRFINKSHVSHIPTKFVITDFSVEIKKEGLGVGDAEDIHARPVPFPGEQTSFEGNKKVSTIGWIGKRISNVLRIHEWVVLETKETTQDYINVPLRDDSRKNFVVIEHKGKMGIGADFFIQGIGPYSAKVRYDPSYYSESDRAKNVANILFTDRPLFKPGDRVFFKSLYRLLNFKGKNSIIQNIEEGSRARGYFQIIDPQNNQLFSNEIIFSNGSTDGFWDIPENGKLGSYKISITYSPNNNDESNSILSSFYVTEYRKPDFLIDLSFDTKAAIWKDKINAEVSAEYAFGGGLAGKEVDYSISLFGRKKTKWWWESKEFRDKLIVQGNGQLDQYGKINIPVDLDIEWDDDIDWSLLTLNTTVSSSQTDSSSQTFSIPFSKANRKIELKSSKSFFQRSETDEATISGIVTDITDRPVKGAKLTATLGRVKWVRNKRKGGDGRYAGEWRRDVESISTKTFLSKNKGRFSKVIDLPEAGGEYQITVTAKDKQGRETNQSYFFWVWSSVDSPYSIRGSNLNRIIPLYRDKDKYNVGDTAEILFPFNEWKVTRAHATLERGEVLETLDVDIEKQQISVPIKKWMNPNVFTTILIEGVNKDGEPEIRWGTIELDIDDPENELEISITPEKEKYKPRDVVKLKIQTNVQKNGKSSEVTIAVVDQTLLALKAIPVKFKGAFFGHVPLGVKTSHTLANFVSKKALDDIYQKVNNIKDIGSNGFGGGGAVKGATFKARGDFRDTAEFMATVQTDKNGFAEVEFELPDNLTTWNIWAIGSTLDNAFGETETKIQATLPLLISPIVPNFFRAGDETKIGLLVKNNTEKKESITITLHLPDTLQANKTEKKISVKNEERVYFDVTVPYDKTKIPLDGIEEEFVINIESKSGLKDAVKLTRKILPPIMQVNVAEFLMVKEPTTVEIKTDERSLQSVLKLNVFRTLLDRISIFVGFAESNNYRGIEQQFTYWTTRLLERDIQKQIGEQESLIPDKQLKKTITDITSIQQGGFRFWKKSDYPNTWLTTHILDFAPIWKKNGVPIPRKNLNDAFDWLKREIMGVCQPKTGKYCMGEATRQYAANILLREGRLDEDDFEFLMNYTSQVESMAWFLRSTDFFSERKLSSDIRKKRNTLYEEIKKLLRTDDRYAFWTENYENRNFYSQDQRITAIVLEYLMKQNALESYYPKIVRFLAEAKNISGNTSLIILRALETYAKNNETSADINIDFSVEETFKNSFLFKDHLRDPQIKVKTLEENLKTNEDYSITFQSDNNKDYYSDIRLEEIFEAKDLSPIEKGFWIERQFYDINDIYFENPLKKMISGQHYRVRVRITTSTDHQQVLVEDSVVTGTEGVNFLLDNVDATIKERTQEQQWRPFVAHQEFYHDKVRFFIPEMNTGAYELQYVVQARIPGKYEQIPPKVQEIYYPEVFATGKGARIEIIK